MKKGAICTVLCLAFLLVLPVCVVTAEQFEERLPLSRYPSVQSFAVFNPGKAEFVKADLSSEKKYIMLSADIPVRRGTMAAAVVKLSSGRVESGPVRIGSGNKIGFLDSWKEAISFKRKKIENLRRKTEALEGEMSLLNLAKRRDAGLDGVDRIYEEIESINRAVSAMEAAGKELADAKKEFVRK